MLTASVHLRPSLGRPTFALCSILNVQQHRLMSSTRRKTKPNRKSKLAIKLTEDVEGLGWAGRVMNVNAGYFRNYLLPRKIAVYATSEDIVQAKQVEEERQKAKGQVSEYDILVADISRKMEREPLAFQFDSDKAFEVTLDNIVEKFKTQMRLHVRPDAIVLAENPRSFGSYAMDVRIDDNTTSTVRMTVTAN